MHVSEAMHRDIQSVSPTMSVNEIAKLMKAMDIGAVPVTENDRMIGMITDRDLGLACSRGRTRQRETNGTGGDVTRGHVLSCNRSH